MDKYKKYMGVILFILAVGLMIFAAVTVITPLYNDWKGLREKVEIVTRTLEDKKAAKASIIAKIKRLQESIMQSQKKIYSPVESNLENDTLFFTLYSDMIEMVRANTIKIKSIDYKYNPANDIFVEQKGAFYFVCDVDMEVVSNYVNLGKLIQDIYQYPYYVKINKIDVTPYQQDKKILISNISLRLYAHTTPEDLFLADLEDEEQADESSKNTIEGAEVPLPQ